MTPRQACNIIVYCVLLPITIAVWAQFLPLPQPAPAPKLQGKPPASGPAVTWPPPKEPQVWQYTVCGIAGAENCWVVGAPIR
jgi:hypothetical protein